MLEFFETLARRAAVAGEAPAVLSPAAAVSYAALLDRVRAHAQWALSLPHRVGLLFGKGPEAIVADLALSFAGKELVPLPDFFSDAQLSHIVRSSALTCAVTDRASMERALRLGLDAHPLTAEATPSLEPAARASRVIFTSGSTGQPKGVRLATRQLRASIASLAAASQASAADRYLSLLPNALLLEQIAGMYVPLSVGAAIHVHPQPLAATPGDHIAAAAEQSKATATVLVPYLLRAWLDELQTNDRAAPSTLRFIAVGGAPVPTPLATAAWQRSLPIYEGYGLSECCSVVAVNRPRARRAGTAGPPLPGVQVAINDGEIVVGGATVMDGYLGDADVAGPWRTGDLGLFDDDGFLVVTGRKDNVVVTAAGRNVSPEWVEEAIAADRRIGHCVVVGHDGELVALLVPHEAALCRDAAALDDLIAGAVRGLPDYAKPRRHLALSELEFRALNLLTANARPRRREVGRLVAERSRPPHLQPVQ